MFPVVAIINNLRDRYRNKGKTNLRSAHESDPEEVRSVFSTVCQFLVSGITCNQVFLRFFLSASVMFMAAKAKSIELPMAINSVICSNYFQIILPCYMIIQMTREIEILRAARPAWPASADEALPAPPSKQGPSLQPTSRAPSSDSGRERFMASFLQNKTFNFAASAVVITYGAISLIWGSYSIYFMIKDYLR